MNKEETIILIKIYERKHFYEIVQRSEQCSKVTFVTPCQTKLVNQIVHVY
jgi:hypothetical protein